MKIKLCAVAMLTAVTLVFCSCGKEVYPAESHVEAIPAAVPASAFTAKSPNVALPVAVNSKKIVKLPDLPSAVKDEKEIAPQGWSVLDLLKNDFNKDGLQDIVGVIEHDVDEKVMYPRILFVYFNNGNGYSFHFMNQYLVLNRDEGGVYGDPYEELTADQNTFTVNAYGGSAWRWSRNHTFGFKNGEWFLLSAKYGEGYGEFETSYEYDDYKSGTGFRRVTEFSPEKENPKCLEYFVKLNEQPSLKDYSYTYDPSSERIQAPEIRSVGYNAGITPFQGKYPQLDESDILDWNQEYIVYQIPQSENISFIGVCTLKTGNLQMIARYDAKDQREEKFSDHRSVIYKDRLYYCEDISRAVSVRKENEISKQQETVAVQLISMKLDGSDKKVIFRADNPQYKENEIIENGLDYSSLIYEIKGNEIIVQVYGGENEPFYKMDLQGGERRLLGSIPKGDWKQ